MSRTAFSLAAAALPLVLAACTSSPSSVGTDAGAGAEAGAVTAPPAADAPKRCDAGPAQTAVGKKADQAVVDQAIADSGSANARVIKPGEAVTMDFREDRLNIEVDAAGMVVAVRCG